MPLKELIWRCLSKHVIDILTAGERAIIDAMKPSWQRYRQVIEPICAEPLEVIPKNPRTFAGRCVDVILTGGDVDLDRLPWTKC